MKSLRRLLVGGLCASAMLCSSCAHRKVIPDPTVPHQVAEEAEIVIWVEQANGKKSKQEVRLLEGWWIAGPPVVDP
jgi:hypothetical protein